MKQKFLSLFTSRIARIALPLIILVLGLVLTGSRVALQKSTFTASARLWIPTKFFSFNKETEASATGESALTTGPNALRTACEIMHSDAVTKLAYDELKTKLGETCPSADAIQAGVRAKPFEGTDILDISYSASSPETAVTILTEVLNAFYRENNMQVAEPIQKSKERLEQQLKVAQAEYSKVKNKQKSFQDSSTFIDLQADVTALSMQKTETEKAIEDCKHDLVGYKSRLDYAQKQLGFGPESVVAVQKLSDDEIMRGLRQSIAETEVNLIQLRSKYQDEHPKVKRLKASLEEAKKGMEARYTAIIGHPGLKENMISGNIGNLSGGSTGSSTGSSSGGIGSENAQTKLIADMAESSTGIATMNAKIASLSSSLGAVRSKLSTVPARQMELANIHRADELATNSLTSIERELQKIHLSESVANGSSSSMQVIDQPSITGTSTPNTWIMGAGGSVFCAALMAIVQFLLAPKYINASRLSSLIPIRIVGFIPKVQTVRGQSASLVASVDRIRLSVSEWFAPGDNLPVIITSACKDDGKSTTAYALSVCLADSGKNVLLIDADTKSPSIHRMASISASPGVLQYLDEPTCDSFEVMQAVRENLTVIPAGGVADGGSCIKDPRFTRLIAESNKNFDVVIIDSEDCGESLDSLVTPIFACRFLAIVRLGKSLIKPVQNLAAQLDMLSTVESALVVNSVEQNDVNQLRQSNPNKSAMIASVPADSSRQSVEGEPAAW